MPQRTTFCEFFPSSAKKNTVSTGLDEFLTLSLLQLYRKADLNVTFDNFSTSLSLAKKLLQQNKTLVGTISSHRRDILNKICFEKDAALYLSNFLFT